MKIEKSSSKQWLTTIFLIAFSVGIGQKSFAQSPTPLPPATKVMVNLTIKAGAPRDELIKTMPEEVSATVKLYLDGKIDQWYSRTDGKGVVFLVNSKDTEEAKTLMDELPLAKHGFAECTYTLLSPLTPLRYLLQSPAAGSRNAP